MGLMSIAWGPAGQTHDVRYVCSDGHGNGPCLADALARHVSIEWSWECDTVSTWRDEDGTAYQIIFSPNDSDASEHVYCWACGDLVSHGDGADSVDRYDDRVCDEDRCTWPEYVDPAEYFSHPLA